MSEYKCPDCSRYPCKCIEINAALNIASECPADAGCSMAGRDAEEKLIEIYERQAVESAVFLMTKLNRGQIKMIREIDPKLATFFRECLSH
jgi:hypothetical protein